MKKVTLFFATIIQIGILFWQKRRFLRYYLGLAGLWALAFFAPRMFVFFTNWRRLEETMSLFNPDSQTVSIVLLLDLLRGAGLILTLLLWLGLVVYFISFYRQHHEPWVEQAPQLAAEAPKLWQVELITDLLAEGGWFVLVSIVMQVLTNGMVNSFIKDLDRFTIWKDAVTLYAYPIAADSWAIASSLSLILLFLYFTELLGKRKVMAAEEVL